MPHPSLGMPPADALAGLPDAAARLRANRERICRVALQGADRLEPGLAERYGDDMLRTFLRDYNRHLEQLAKALESGDDGFVVNYGEWLVPIYRRRRVSMRDFMALLGGLRDAAGGVLTPEENRAAALLFERWNDRLKHHGRLPGDHKGNPIIRFFWKGAGIGDDKWI
ncbi:MAG TPA: hypothetical protein VM284_05490 [Candidatus Limnocylindria bacterium]|nr:hypothetical protein [Candidatus Limnocylindria bacterium]